MASEQALASIAEKHPSTAKLLGGLVAEFDNLDSKDADVAKDAENRVAIVAGGLLGLSKDERRLRDFVADEVSLARRRLQEAKADWAGGDSQQLVKDNSWETIFREKGNFQDYQAAAVRLQEAIEALREFSA